MSIIEKLTDQTVKISKSTITLLNDNGKVKEMITGVETYFTMSSRKVMDCFFDTCKKNSVNRLDLDNRKLFRIDDK